ncbi:hypothetical protein ABZY36_36935 [Streptomyces sp. NPDC006627]
MSRRLTASAWVAPAAATEGACPWWMSQLAFSQASQYVCPARHFSQNF